MTIVGKLKISPHVEKFQKSPLTDVRDVENVAHIEPKSTFVGEKMANIRSEAANQP